MHCPPVDYQRTYMSGINTYVYTRAYTRTRTHARTHAHLYIHAFEFSLFSLIPLCLPRSLLYFFISASSFSLFYSLLYKRCTNAICTFPSRVTGSNVQTAANLWQMGALSRLSVNISLDILRVNFPYYTYIFCFLNFP